ncbi:IS982 family transposase [Lactiplantibacillus sp. WILCCON 0030]|uniref:IS982 family transposase n=1 Tax=Lactiplantibacillus brownii TaxID=3069269 RepID=A0ABU1AAT9_9LACO|nr:IS982 family transposase [Lactiplantibacillus brownii]MDQ7936118.1 IS982 family transposase [Lactiplantibacillus brownii]MDQ7936591.1 IS982 family transposase [Lactiplantibacillus brownii]MDQ7936988.1 IS982 family transposase [Lactiplantibacillus brownii]MDQ7937754.1 IS982 family transposase [Lactiplantibacillus brownii]MDQ7938036.1 IS982 family transposase [Lactiplantibacillus brownii]
MQGLLKAIPKFNLIQATVQEFIKIITPIYQLLPKRFRFRQNYRQLKVNDVTIIACMLARIALRDPSETHFHQTLAASGVVVPERSRYNRRCRDLLQIMKLIRQYLLKRYRHGSTYEIIDSAPITLVSARRSNQAKVLRGVAHKGYNATKQLYYYGFKLHAVMDNDGYFVNWELTPANVDDRKPVEELLREAPAHQVLADGGYLSRKLQERLKSQGINFWFPLRKNMRKTDHINSSFLKNQRRYIETGFNNLNIVGHFEHPGTRTLIGLGSRLAALFLWNIIKVHSNLAQGKSGLSIN